MLDISFSRETWKPPAKLAAYRRASVRKSAISAATLLSGGQGPLPLRRDSDPR